MIPSEQIPGTAMSKELASPAPHNPVHGVTAAPDSERVAALIALFDRCFAQSHNTRLVRGEAEPIYLPAGPDRASHQLVFAHGFFASALHEIAHWCIAGTKRRQQVDYGYWYCPDGRSAEQQHRFEQVEARPQALEWIFSRAAGHRFRISVDNLAGIPTDPAPFRAAVWRAAQQYCRDGLPSRAALFHRELARHFGGDDCLDPVAYDLAALS